MRVFNADPMPRDLGKQRSDTSVCQPTGARQDPLLKYNELSKETVYPWNLTKYLRYHADEASKTISNKESCNLDVELKKLSK